MVDLHLVLPALNLSTMDAGILIMVQLVRMMGFSLNMVDYSMSFLSLSTLKVIGWVVVIFLPKLSTLNKLKVNNKNSSPVKGKPS